MEELGGKLETTMQKMGGFYVKEEVLQVKVADFLPLLPSYKACIHLRMRE